MSDTTKAHIEVLNQLFALEQKLKKDNLLPAYERYLNRMKQAYQELGASYHDPIHEKYNDTRTDVEASITGNAGDNLFIAQVIKPVIFIKDVLVQRGIVIVENR